MSEVKALFPIGKTQWRKWNDTQRKAFNALREQGESFPDAVALASSMTGEPENLVKVSYVRAPHPQTVKRTFKRKVK